MTRRQQRRVERLVFGAENGAEVVERMARLAAVGDGWINLLPAHDEDDEPPAPIGFYTQLSGGGLGFTMCTWIPARRDRPGSSSRLGLSHGAGRRLRPELLELGVAIPPSWRIQQDHPRRGLVVLVPPGEADEELLAWALRTMTALLAPHPIAAWRAEIHLPLDPERTALSARQNR
jgi:hypothetical protein